MAHRLVVEHETGVELDGKIVLHLCDNTSCVRIDHLRVGSYADNEHDKKRKGRYRNASMNKTHCPQGHEYTDANTYTSRSCYRHCRFCQKQHRTEWRQRQRGRVVVQESPSTEDEG
jgi:hypothetical protein